jgi:glycosyltransferase involved in cell wall biosynthesis
MTKGQVLISTKSFPPVVGGSAYLIYELLRHFPDNYFTVCHGVNDPPKAKSQLELAFRRKQIKFINLTNTPRAVRRLPKIYLNLITKQLQRAIDQGNIRKIYAHYPNGLFLYAAYKVAVKNKLPLVVYFDILWEELSSGFELDLAKRYEKEIVSYSETVVAITEFAATYMSEKHQRTVEFIPHTVDVGLINISSNEIVQPVSKLIHFAGGIHEVMNEDSVLRITNAVEKMGENLVLEFYSPDLPTELTQKGYANKYVSKDELVAAQRRSSILLLPQSFNSSRPSMIRNNFPTKTMEYVCSGVPILVHSPKDSYLSYLAKKEGFGLVVDIADEDALIDAISRLQTEPDLRKKLVTNAYEFARKMDSRKWSSIFKNILD